MRIIFLTRLYYPHVGGVETHVAKLSQTLLAKGHFVTVITTQYENSLNLQDYYQDVRIIRIPRENQGKLATWRWMITDKELFQNVDVIHAHDVYWWYIPLRFLINKPNFVTFHGWEGTFPPQLSAKLWRKVSELLSQGNICVGEFIEKWYGTNPNLVTYGATNQKELPQGDKDRILVFGRISHDNDLPLVISALKVIKKRFPHLKISFLGDGSLAHEANKVGTVLGFQSNFQDHLQSAYWVISSSYLSVLESLAAGRQAISVYSNPLKKDYLLQHPMAKHMIIAASTEELVDKFTDHYYQRNQHSTDINLAAHWAQSQTWEKLAQEYINLWTHIDYSAALQQLQKNLEKPQ